MRLTLLREKLLGLGVDLPRALRRAGGRTEITRSIRESRDTPGIDGEQVIDRAIPVFR
jgi:hypothetical protein